MNKINEIKKTLRQVELVIDMFSDLDSSTSIRFEDYDELLSPSIESMHMLRIRLERQIESLEDDLYTESFDIRQEIWEQHEFNMGRLS